MRIACISDLHIDINADYPVLDELCKIVSENKTDILLVAGDICESCELVSKAAEKLEKDSGAKVLYVPGNHDMWAKNTDKDSDELYEYYREDPRCLTTGKSYEFEVSGKKYVILGDIGWYDYSFASKIYSDEELDKMSLDGRTWQDKNFNVWTRDNKGKCEEMLKNIEKDIHNFEKSGYNIIYMTHMLPIKDFDVPETYKGWGFFNAFLGTVKLGDIFEAHEAVKFSISGHVHFRKTAEHGHVKYLLPCLNYHTEWQDGLTIKGAKGESKNGYTFRELSSEQQEKNRNRVKVQLLESVQYIDI